MKEPIPTQYSLYATCTCIAYLADEDRGIDKSRDLEMAGFELR